MTRRHILTAPFAALLGSTVKPSGGDLRYSPRAMSGEIIGKIIGGHYFPRTRPDLWKGLYISNEPFLIPRLEVSP